MIEVKLEVIHDNDTTGLVVNVFSWFVPATREFKQVVEIANRFSYSKEFNPVYFAYDPLIDDPLAETRRCAIEKDLNE